MRIVVWCINTVVSLGLLVARWAAGLAIGYWTWNLHMMLYTHFVDGGPFPWYLNYVPEYFTMEPGVLWLVPVFLIANVVLPLMCFFPTVWPLVLAGLGFVTYKAIK